MVDVKFEVGTEKFVKCSSLLSAFGTHRKKSTEFRVCTSVHHRTFKWINQPDAAISQVYCLSFKYSSTCFGHPHAHHQGLNCRSSFWFTVGTWWWLCCWSWSGRLECLILSANVTTRFDHLQMWKQYLPSWFKLLKYLHANLIYKAESLFVCLFVCTLYKCTFLNQSEPNFVHISPFVWKRP